jgi:hypothetical protein
MTKDIIRFEEQDRSQDDDDNEVKCARCGKMIPGDSLRCPKCGVHFQGQAQDFYHASEMPTAGQPMWVIVTAVVLLLFTIAVIAIVAI